MSLQGGNSNQVNPNQVTKALFSKLENKFLLTKPDFLIVYVQDTSFKIVLNPRNVIFVKVNIKFQFVVQKSKKPFKKCSSQRYSSTNNKEQETEEASVNQVISSVENLIQKGNIRNDTTTATSKTRTQTLDPDPEKPRPKKAWTQKNLDPEKHGL